MENHPIPQDVTGFQFKLIGEMTVKQFAYLAGGIVLAWVTFSLPLFWLIKFPFVFLFVGLGVCLAFVPVEGRPFDVMLMNFLKAFISPSQFVFQKAGYTLIPEVRVVQKAAADAKPAEEKNVVSEKNLQKYLNSLPKTPRNSLDEKEMRILGALPLQQTAPQYAQPVSNPYAIPQALSTDPATKQGALQSSTVMLTSQPVIQQAPQETRVITEQMQQPQKQLTPEEEDVKNQTLEKEAQLIQQELTQAKQEEVKQQNTATGTVAHEKVVELEKELSDILSQKESLQNQLITLKKELEKQKQQVFSPSIAQAPVQKQTQNVRMVPQGLGKSVGLPITPDVPNLLTGIIKDARGNTLPNILVEVKDPDGNPVRAFKTNGLGQFAAATPLSNGTYTLTFEDPQGKQKFDAVELPVNGMIIQPLEVISVDAREELRKELFSV
jgi:hypothetical protein